MEATNDRKPFVTKKVAAGYMIQRGGQNHDAEWWTPDGWNGSVFEAAFWRRRKQARKAYDVLFG
jgi:hypothetical protein